MRKAHELDSDPTLARVVRRAVEVCDPGGHDDALARLLERFEDRDEPVSGVAEVARELAEATGESDPQGEDPLVTMARAVATYLAYRRTELDRDPDDLLRRAAASEFDGHPPEHVTAWLAGRGVQV